MIDKNKKKVKLLGGPKDGYTIPEPDRDEYVLNFMDRTTMLPMYARYRLIGKEWLFVGVFDDDLKRECLNLDDPRWKV